MANSYPTLKQKKAKHKTIAEKILKQYQREGVSEGDPLTTK